MKRAALLLLALLSFSGLHAETLSINKFGGLNTDDSPLTLDGQTPDSQNVVTDDGPGVKGRQGFIVFSTDPASGMWEFPVSNGTRYIIKAYKSAGLLKANTGDGNFTTTISTIPTDRDIVASPLGDKFFFSDTTNGLKYWNTASTTTVDRTLTFDKLVTFKGRLVGAGVSSNPRLLYLSKYLDGTTFTLATNPSDDDPAQITVSGALDENITALYSSFQDKLIWFKAHSFGGIFGSRRSNFTQRTFSDTIGTGTPDSVRDCAGFLRWLGPDRRIWEFDGSTFYKITEDIDNLMVNVAQGDSNSRTNTQTSQADWQAGTQSPSSFLDLTTAIGDQTPATSTLLDTLQSDFQAGSGSPAESADVTTSSGSLSAKVSTNAITSAAQWGAGSYDTTTFVDTETSSGNLQTVFPDTCDSIRDGSSGTKNVWNAHDLSSGGTVTTSASGGTCAYSMSAVRNISVQTTKSFYIGSSGATFYFTLSAGNSAGGGADTFFAISNQVSTGSANLFNMSVPGPSAQAYFYVNFLTTTTASFEYNIGAYKNAAGSETQLSFTPSRSIDASSASAHANYPATIMIFIGTNTFVTYLNGTRFYSANHTFDTTAGPWYVTWQKGPSSSQVNLGFDNFTIAPQTFTYTSATWDTGLVTGPRSWGIISSTTSGTGSITFTTQASADDVTYDTAVSATTGSVVTSLAKRYLKVKAALNYNSTSSTSAFTGGALAISDIGTIAFETMTFTSRSFDTAMSTPVWGLFYPSTAAVNGGGTSSFKSQSSADGASWDAAVSLSSGVQPTSTSHRYWRYVLSSTPSVSGGYERVDSVTLAVKSTGTFTSQTIDFGTAISAYGPIVINATLNGGTITYQFSSASTSAGVGGSWTTFTSGATPSGSVNRYAAVRAVYSMTVATQAPTVSDITLSWYEGSTLKTASAYFNSRYWLSVAISSTSNNRILVYDKKKQWQLYSGINADAMALYNSRLYFANTSGIWQAENGYNDNGASIAAYYRTPTFIPNKLDLNSNFNYLYMTTDASDSTLASSYQVNGIATDYSLASVQMNGTTGIQNFKLPFAMSEVQTGKLLSFKWSVTGTSFWRINNGTLYHEPLALPE
jgi:hypothetical protein